METYPRCATCKWWMQGITSEGEQLGHQWGECGAEGKALGIEVLARYCEEGPNMTTAITFGCVLHEPKE